MARIVTDSLIAQARDRNSDLTRAERSQIFADRMLEDEASNKRYNDGRSVKDAIDAIISAGGTPGGFKRTDTLGRAYSALISRYRQK